jgi:hypothetical protein
VRVPSRVTAVGVAWFTCLQGAFEEGVGVAESPSGTVTALFTDLEGSTRLWQEHPEAMLGLPRARPSSRPAVVSPRAADAPQTFRRGALARLLFAY